MAHYKSLPTKGVTVVMALRGRTLRAIAESGTIMKALCNECPHRRHFPPLEVRSKPRFRPFLDEDVMRFAEKLRCGKCRSRDLFLTIHTGLAWGAALRAS